jgi:uncharacterized membrane protein YoaK (UPF0700 family)
MPAPSRTRATSSDYEALRRAALSLEHPLARALIVLTFTTGLIDAVSYLGLGRVFSANMTGNIVLLGFGIAGAGGLPVLAPIVSLGAFAVGAGVGGMLARQLGNHHTQHIARTLAIEVLLLVLAAVVAAVLNVRPNHLSGDLVIALMALAMGVRNATVRRIGVPDLTTTVLTLTLTGLAADLRHPRTNLTASARRLFAVLAMLIGALVGALVLKTGPAWVLALAAVLATVTGARYLTHPSSSDAGE